ncbi:hypothetical protein T01_12709 [Trichinella spiralis]|nr:hypothetical protein T01_12709 [Trichinella spiralis]
MAREKAKQTFRIQGRRRRAASSVASLGYGLHPERAHQESNPLVPELFISTSLNDPPGWEEICSTRRSCRRRFVKLKRPLTILEEDRVSQPLSLFQLLTGIDYADLPATEDRDPDWRPSRTNILILEDNLPQTRCLIRVISQLFPGRDGVVRALRILTSKEEVTRLVAKLVVLEPASVANGEEDSLSRGKIVDNKT